MKKLVLSALAALSVGAALLSVGVSSKAQAAVQSGYPNHKIMPGGGVGYNPHY